MSQEGFTPLPELLFSFYTLLSIFFPLSSWNSLGFGKVTLTSALLRAAAFAYLIPLVPLPGWPSALTNIPTAATTFQEREEKKEKQQPNPQIIDMQDFFFFYEHHRKCSSLSVKTAACIHVQHWLQGSKIVVCVALNKNSTLTGGSALSARQYMSAEQASKLLGAYHQNTRNRC